MSRPRRTAEHLAWRCGASARVAGGRAAARCRGRCAGGCAARRADQRRERRCAAGRDARCGRRHGGTGCRAGIAPRWTGAAQRAGDAARRRTTTEAGLHRRSLCRSCDGVSRVRPRCAAAGGVGASPRAARSGACDARWRRAGPADRSGACRRAGSGTHVVDRRGADRRRTGAGGPRGWRACSRQLASTLRAATQPLVVGGRSRDGAATS